ncbi:MAG: LamG-like jellyroll fold domain-containing protein [Verrucomicrobiota bacterium]
MKDRDTIKEKIDAYRAGEISPDDFAALEQTLKESAEVRAYFRSYLHLDTELRRLAESDPAIESAWAGDKPEQPQSRTIIRPRWKFTAAAIAMAAAFVAIAGLAWLFAPRWMPVGDVVATLSQTSGARIRMNGRVVVAQTGTSLHQGRFELVGGLIEITYPSGVVALLESPATFEMRDAASLTLTNGKVSATVPENATGFSVITPSSTIVDLGTEFGVEAGADNSEVHVFKGAVSLETSHADGPQLLTEHKASRIDTLSGTPAGINYDADKFLQRLTESPKVYPKLTHSLKPVAYYRMKITPDGALLKDATDNSCDGTIVWGKSCNPWAPGRIGASLNFGGASMETYARVPEIPKATNGTLSVCAWVQANSRPRWASIAKNWTPMLGGQFHFGLWQDDGALEVHVHDSQDREIGVRDSEPLPIGQWQFVAFTLDGTTLRLYRNGMEVGSIPCDGLSLKAPPALGIGVKLDPTGIRPDSSNAGFWSGRIDELAIFHHALSESDIRRLYEAAPRTIDPIQIPRVSENPVSLNPSHLAKASGL